MENINEKALKSGMKLSSASLLTIKRIALVLAVLSVVVSCILGFICCVYAENGLAGLIYFVGGTALSIIGYLFIKFILWIAYDIKLIRNKFYGVSADDDLDKFVKDFVDLTDDTEDIEDTDGE